VGRSFATRLVG